MTPTLPHFVWSLPLRRVPLKGDLIGCAEVCLEAARRQTQFVGCTCEGRLLAASR